MASEQEGTVVCDNGSAAIKAGFSCPCVTTVDEVCTHTLVPHAVFPTLVGRPKTSNVMLTMRKKECYVGDEAQCMRGVLSITHPVEHGVITDWDDMEKLWHHMFFDELRAAPEDHNLLITEAPLNYKGNREKMVQIMFETFNVPNFYVAVAPVLSLYTVGLYTGIALDSGESTTSVVPIYEGYSLPHAVLRNDIGGRDITDRLNTLLRDRGNVFVTSSERQIVCDIKEKLGYVAFTPKRYADDAGGPLECCCCMERLSSIIFHPCGHVACCGDCAASVDSCPLCRTVIAARRPDPGVQRDQSDHFSEELAFTSPGDRIVGSARYAHVGATGSAVLQKSAVEANTVGTAVGDECSVERDYELPDGQVITIGTERFQCAELLFQPMLGGFELKGVHELLHSSIMKCDIDLRKGLFNNIVLCGGTSKFPAFKERLTQELEELKRVTMSGVKIKMRVPAGTDVAWRGGAVLAKIMRDDAWLTKEHYDECGPGAVHQRCF